MRKNDRGWTDRKEKRPKTSIERRTCATDLDFSRVSGNDKMSAKTYIELYALCYV